ncbi:MAG: 16S rRNA (uracil(1498)-N(3))-methyltransferase [Eubacterium sp.]|nr:16S rRNA (uracil(1498)-N(3))-methyltransferase [Eubacterium sp.]MBR1674299.1 16S rRNA (uracil(1498)-N(3))-methyltransferase [Eubacterium sp.]
MYRFYVEGCSNASDKIYISGKDQNHIKNVLRLRIGEEIIISDGTSRDYHCRIADYPEDMVEAEIIDITDNATELPAQVVLFQGMPKADKFEHIIQKTVELGVHEIYPVMMKRCVVKLEGGNGSTDKNGFLTVSSKEAKKIQRYNNIAEAAAKQSQRGIIPEVKSFVSFKRAAEIASEMDVVLVPYESAEGMDYSRNVIAEIKKLCTESSKRPMVAVFIGPEGGFAQEEIDLLSEKGGRIISLGRRILRTETAGPAIMSVMGFALDE